MKLFAITSLLLAAAVFQGCSSTPSAWVQHYDGAPEGTYGPTESVTLREVPWSRLTETLEEIEAERADSDIHRDEWEPERAMQEQIELLRGLQISGDPEQMVILGRSAFRTVDQLDPDDGSLDEFARSIGADYALWSADLVGTRSVTRNRPVHHSGFSTGVGFGSRGRGFGGGPWVGTTYVPVAVDADEYAWVVYYLRRE